MIEVYIHILQKAGASISAHTTQKITKEKVKNIKNIFLVEYETLFENMNMNMTNNKL